MTALERVDYADGESALTGWLARPAGIPRAAVLVFPTIMNVTPFVEAKAQALTEQGYLALIADFYGTPVADFAASMVLAGALRADVDGYRTRLRAGLTALAKLVPDLPKAAIGFCMGGQAVLELARENADIALAASFHGILETYRPAPVGGPVSPRILICHGDADALVPRSQVIAFWEEMDLAKANWHFHSYSGVGHGFANPNPSPANGSISFDASADRQSWTAMLSLFDEVFGQASR
ncbi:MAG: dienelactone hydrolase family protein [Novosphingobium sp.]